MKKIKYMLIVLFIILIILIVVIIIYNNKKNYLKNNYKEINNAGFFEPNKNIKEVNDVNQYYSLQYVTNKLNEYISDNNKDGLINILSESYKKDKNINEKNVINIFLKYKEKIIFDKVYVLDGYSSFYFFIKTTNNLYLLANMDFVNMTFSIEPYDEENYNYTINNGSSLSEISIEKNQYNNFEYQYISDESICRLYIENYQYYLLNNIDMAYQKLDEEYKNKKFGNINNFKKYISDNYDKINNITLSKYYANNKDDYIEYTCIDTNNNYYCFKANAVMNYTVILDNYTIENSSYDEEYKNASDEKKVITNVDKFVKMLNNADYNSAYNCLADEFKNNYFKTEDTFEKYIKEYFFKNNIIETVDINKQSGLYKYKINIKSGNNLASESITKTFIVKLGEGTDFKLSFNVE